LVKATRELIADGGGAVDRELMSALSIAAADAIDTAIISGDGALQPSGILTRAAAGDVPLTALSGVPSWTAAFSAIERVLDADGNPPTSAVCSPRVWLDLPGGRLADGDGDPVEVPRAFEAINWFPTTKVIASGGSTSSIIFGGFEQVTLVLREAPTFQVLLERFATEGVIGIVCNMRADVVLGRSAHLDVIGSVTE
jgi:HK97 family phage major capsid protein